MTKLKFKEGNHHNAPRIPKKRWDEMKSIILELYVTQNKSKQDVCDIMEQEHGFCATVRQYTHTLMEKWKIRKYRQKGSPRQPLPLRGRRRRVEPSRRPQSARRRRRRLHMPPAEEPSSSNDSQTQNPGVVSPVPPLQILVRNPATHVARPSQPMPFFPQLDPVESSLRHRRLAEILFELGDIYPLSTIRPALGETEGLTTDIITCVRKAQKREQADAARDLLKPIAAALSGDSWTTTLLAIFLAHTYGSDTHGIFQIESIVHKLVIQNDDGRDRLKPLAPRAPHLDIPAYLFLESTLLLYNHHHNHSQEHCEVQITNVMEDFLNQQPAFHGGLENMRTNPLRDINCLPSCLTWCTEILTSNSRLVVGVSGTSSESPLADLYAVLLTLWHLWLISLPLSPSFNPAGRSPNLPSPSSWSDNAESQLGILPTDLLAAVVRMIMAAVPAQDGEGNEPLLKRARAGVGVLAKLLPKELIRRFLGNVYATDRRLVWQACNKGRDNGQDGGVDAAVVEPYRQLAARTLQIGVLPRLAPGEVVYPPLLRRLGELVGS